MVTIKQIAERAGVSTTTVSNVIHGNVKRVSNSKIAEIQRLVDEMGYVEPMSLSILHKKKSRMLAVIVKRHQLYDTSVLGDPFYGQVIGHIQEELQKNNYYMLFYSADHVEDIFNMVKTWNVDGVILISMSQLDCNKVRTMIKKPVVCIDPVRDGSPKSEVGYIYLDDRKGGYLMTRHLISQGYENIHICSADVNYGVDRYRLQGAQKAMEEFNKDGKVKLIPQSIGISYMEREKFYQHLHKTAPFKKRTAIFCLSDRFALEVITYMMEQGLKIPEDLGIAGFDGISSVAKNTFPRLTTIRQNIFQKAQLAVREILASVEDETYNMEDQIVDVSLLKRKSC